MRSLSVPEHVHHSAASHGGSVLLDLKSGQWYAMNPVADALWQTWRHTGDFEAAVGAVVKDHPGASGDRVREDALRLAHELAARGLVVLGGPLGFRRVGPAHDEARTTRVPVTVAIDASVGVGYRVIALVAFAVAVVLLRLPFRTTVRLVRALRDGWCHAPATTVQVTAVAAAVRRMTRWYPGRTACLESSLAEYLMMTTLRLAVDWVIGAAADPYRFHAWVEVDNAPIASDSNVDFGEFRRVLKI
jgi:hypothetical protein